MKATFTSSLFLFLTALILFACYHEQEIPVLINVEYVVPQNGYTVPVQIEITNETTGADFYLWSFEGGSPASSDKKYPGLITYRQAGTYIIKLEAWNDTQRNVREITVQLDSTVTLDFDYEILINDFVPATVALINKTRGASTYDWTFEGGDPATATSATPPPVYFDAPGDHVISLKATNGRETFFTSKTITLSPALEVDFSIVPSFEDEDYEAPLTASLENSSISGLRYSWSSNGGMIANAAGENTSIHFDSPGNYLVTLVVENDKETKSAQHTINVKANSNLYKMEDVRLGISAAHSSLGSFYSTQLRRTLKREEVNADNGKLVDIVFYGINSGFSYCRFVSPDSAAKFTFPAISQSSHTAVVNTLESSTLTFSVADFDAMDNDVPIKNLSIKENDTRISFFNSSVVPRIILFETEDRRKGAIKVKSFVSNGAQSYITVDVKVQKK